MTGKWPQFLLQMAAVTSLFGCALAVSTPALAGVANKAEYQKWDAEGMRHSNAAIQYTKSANKMSVQGADKCDTFDSALTEEQLTLNAVKKSRDYIADTDTDGLKANAADLADVNKVLKWTTDRAQTCRTMAEMTTIAHQNLRNYYQRYERYYHSKKVIDCLTENDLDSLRTSENKLTLVYNYLDSIFASSSSEAQQIPAYQKDRASLASDLNDIRIGIEHTQKIRQECYSATNHH